MFACAGIKCPQIQLGAENNIEKSRCLAQMRKKIRASVARGTGFSGFCVYQGHPAPHTVRIVHCEFRHVGADVQRSSTSKAPIAIDTQRKEKSI
jgi:hypothetical protein